jgi:hypothetical protein
MKSTVVLLFSLILLTGCSENAGVGGRLGEQIKGKNLKVQAFYMNPGKSPLEMPTVNVTNDSDKTINIAPLTITAWFKQAGMKEKTIKSGEMIGNEQMPPRKTVMLSAEALKFDVAPSDQLDKLRLSIAGGEVFTINP